MAGSFAAFPCPHPSRGGGAAFVTWRGRSSALTWRLGVRLGVVRESDMMGAVIGGGDMAVGVRRGR